MDSRRNKLAAWLLSLNSRKPVFVTKTDEDEPEISNYEVEPVKKEPRKPLFKNLSQPVGIFIAILAVWLIIWSLGNVLFTRVKLGNTSLWSHASLNSTEQKINAIASSYKLTITYQDNSHKSYDLSQIGLSVDAKATALKIKKPHLTLSNRLEWWRPTSATLSLNTNMSALNSFIINQATVTVQPPTDAAIVIKNGQVSVSGGSTGKQYGLVNPDQLITRTVASLSPNIKLETLAVNPAINSDQLASSANELKQVVNQSISFNIDGQIIKASPSDIANWIEISPSDSKKTVDISVDSGKVLNYINAIAKPYIHPPRDQVVVTHDDGTTSVLVPGESGVDVQDKQTIATSLADSLLAAKDNIEVLPVVNAPYQTITTANYPKWIEVDLTNKRMYAYEQTNLVKTFLVSAGAPKTPTVTGQYSIYAKFTSQDMKGENVDGSSYAQPNVPWVNYFYRDYAIHGNYWRPLSYFGNVNSSHGCVGVIPSDGEWIYDWAPIGTPVIVHT